MPLIQGFNADEASITAITNFAADELGVEDIHFLPYHTLGMNKYTLLGQPYSAPDNPLDNPALLGFAQQYAPPMKGLTATLRDKLMTTLNLNTLSERIKAHKRPSYISSSRRSVPSARSVTPKCISSIWTSRSRCVARWRWHPGRAHHLDQA